MKDIHASRRRVAGFTLVETLLAISLIALVAIMGSRTLLGTTRAIHRMIYQKKASSLAEMVFQQYSSYASDTYQMLDQYNIMNQPPKTFFKSPDNFGYDFILITTTATFSSNKSSCTVTVTLSWHDAGETKTTSYVKTYVGGAQTSAGALVDVYVKSPCPLGTTPELIKDNCPGIANFYVSAVSSNGGSVVSGYTDLGGHIQLPQVLVSGNSSIQITVPPVVDVSSSATPSYYGPQDSNGNYVTTLNKPIALTPGVSNMLVVTDFLPTGQIVGQVISDDTSNNPSLTNMSVNLGTGSIVGYGGSFQICGTGVDCSVPTNPDGSGRFLFNNVIPIPMAVVGAGRPGSFPTVQEGAPGFSWGYSNSASSLISGTDWSNSAGGRNPTTKGPIVSESVHLQRLGWLVVQVTNKITGVPVPGFNANAYIMPMAFQSLPWDSPAVISDASGVINLYNVFGSNGVESIMMSGGRKPQSGDYGYSGSSTPFSLHDTMGEGNNITYQVVPGFLLTGQFTDANPVNGLAGMVATQYLPYPGVTANLTPSGNFSYAGFIPSTDASSAISTNISLYNRTLQVSNTLTGNTVDQVTGAIAPHTSLSVRSAYANVLSSSNAVGYFNFTSTFSYYNNQPIVLQCDDTSLQCVMCPPGSATCPAPGIAVPIDTRINRLSFIPTGGHGYVYKTTTISATQGTPTSPLTLSCTLQDYAVKGSVTDLASHGIANITILDGDGIDSETTADGTGGTTLGAYTGWAMVDSRDASDVGTISLSVAAQAGYLADNAGPFSLPTSPILDPTVPMTETLQLSPNPSGNGGGI